MYGTIGGFRKIILPLMLCGVRGIGQAVHSLPLFQGYTMDWLFDAVLTVVRGNMAGLAGKVALGGISSGGGSCCCYSLS